MQQELQRDHPFLGVGCRVGKFGGELIDLVDSAGVIDKMPLSSSPAPLLAAVPVGVPVAISPHRRAGDIVSSEIISVGGEDASHLRSNPSIKKLLSDQRDNLMPFATPG